MILFLYGEDTYRSHKKIKGIKKKYLNSDQAGTNICILYANEVDFDKIAKAVETMPFLANKRLVIIKDLLNSNKQKLQEEVAEYLHSIPETTVLIFWEKGGVKKKGKLFKELRKISRAQEFELLVGIKLNNWIEQEVKKLGGKIEKEAVARLASYVGSDLWQMANEISKLVSYKVQGTNDKGQRSSNSIICVSDVELLVKAKLNTNIFEMVDALGEKDTKKTTELVDDLLTSGETEGYLLSMITYQFRNLLIVKDLTEKKLNKFQIAKQTNIHPYVVSKTIPQSKNFTEGELEEIYSKLLYADKAIKTGKLQPRLALDLLVAELCRSS